MRAPSLSLLAALALLSFPFAASAQNPNLLADNPSFDRVGPETENLWDGVDSAGNIAVFTYSARVQMENRIGGLAMPPSVGYADLRATGRPDLIVADPTGYFRFYPNVGTAQSPRFGPGQILPLFLSTTYRPREHEWSWNNLSDGWRFCPRFALADWRKSGVLDFIIGNYYGEFFYLPNAGNAKQPLFRQPVPIDSARIVTNQRNRFWGNLFSPVAADWNGDGRIDLITGEGTYSANAVHLWENVGATDAPKFADARHSYLAYGDGREQLIPTVVDYDADGAPDLIVADRSGEVGVYLNPGKSKPGGELKRTATLSFGGNSKMPGLVSPCAADFNADGLFDLLFGLPNGHVAVSLNTGTKGSPAFGPLQDLKSEDRLGKTIRLPNDWITTAFPMYGNALAYFTVESGEGGNILKAGYSPQAGDTFAVPSDGIPGGLKHFTVFHPGLTLEIGKQYQVSFRCRNNGMERLRYSFASHFLGVPPSVKIDRGERGEMRNRNEFVDEWVDEGQNFNAGSSWSNVKGSLTVRYKNPLMQGEKTIVGSFEIDCWAKSLSDTIYFDDFSLVKQGK